MSRVKKFTRSLFSGYLMLGANIFYTLAGVPLALHYLGTLEYGLWALVSQLAGYILLVDLGMSHSVARILIDHKDERHTGAYGSVIKTGALAGLVQGVLVVLLGVALSLMAGPLLHVPMELREKFLRLMAAQSLLTGISLALRIFSNLLFAHQRVDIYNYCACVFFFLNLGAMWAGFAGGLGIYSYLIGQAVMTVGGITVCVVACVRLGFLPQRHEWGGVTRARFREIFTFGGDIFIYSLGTQLVNASQTILLSRLFGLETVAVWNVCTRAYSVLTQVIFRFFDFSAPALAEMIVRGEKNLLAERFKQIVVFSLATAVAAAGLFALCNSAFVTVWTPGRIGWPFVNDLLLALWLVICTAMHAHTGLVLVTKKFHFMRYLFFIEGFAFVGLTLAFSRFGGITAMLMCSLLCTCAFSLPYGFFRTRKYFDLDWRELAAWHRPALVLALWLLPAGILTWLLTHALSGYVEKSLVHSDSRIAAWLLKHNLSALLQLVLGGGIFGLWTLAAFLRHGLSMPLQMEIHRRAPRWSKPVFSRLGFDRSSAGK